MSFDATMFQFILAATDAALSGGEAEMRRTINCPFAIVWPGL
jgi:hypothetical protein